LSDNFVLITGCSGGGKSTLLAELKARGRRVVEEPGRRIVREELERGGEALPWVDPVAFLRRALTMALADMAAAEALPGWVFFDRGLIDAAAPLEELTGEPALKAVGAAAAFHRRVFMAPPWPEIYVTDAERRHGFEAGLSEYERQQTLLPRLGYQVITLPKIPVEARADFVLAALSAA
jgi:predicted ATPase